MRSSFLVLVVVIATATSAEACYPGIESIGTVSPLGDVVLLDGSDLVINCTLHRSYAGPATAADIRWRRNGTDVPASRFVRVLSERTAQLTIPNATVADSGYYSCLVEVETVASASAATAAATSAVATQQQQQGGDQDEEKGGGEETKKERTIVCNNDVRIGYPPAGRINITCLSLNWENMTCSWSPPFNPVPTKWSFYYRLSKYRVQCPVYQRGRTSCFFSEQTIPPYRPTAENYYFFLEGANPLGNARTDFVFSNFKFVLPNPPDRLLSRELDSRRLYVKWSHPFGMSHFPPKLFYRLSYRCDWDDAWHTLEVGLNVTNATLSGLFPNSRYAVAVSCRSGLSPESPWSAEAVVHKTTPADVPSGAVGVVFSGFEQKKSIREREVILHWQSFPRFLENGANLTFVIDAVEDGLQRRVTVTDLSNTSAVVAALDLDKKYVFQIRARNEKGVSANASFVAVGTAAEVLPSPDFVTAIAFAGGRYEVSWKPSELAAAVENYTLFWCAMPATIRPGHRCYNGRLEWTTVDSNATAFNLSLSDQGNFHFAVAANAPNGSSGMTWATCIIPYDGVVGKLKSVSAVHVGATDVGLAWRLSCSERTGIMTGFNVYYCLLDVHEYKCVGNETFMEFEPNPHADHYTLANLRPFSTYRITVSVLTKAGESEQSDPIVNRTAEAAPDDPCVLGLSEVTNTSIGVAIDMPHVTNGVVRQLRFYVNGRPWESTRSLGSREFLLTGLESYRNYSVQVVACTLGELCSPLSEELNVTTKIGVPGAPDLTNVQFQNATHVRVEWEDPQSPNGPILVWTIAAAWTDPESGEPVVRETSFVEDGSRVHFLPLPVPCADGNEVSPRTPEYNFSMRAQTVMLDGLPSKTVVSQPCANQGSEVVPLWLVSLIAVGSVALILVVCLLLRGFRRLKRKMREMRNIKVQLPKGLDSPNMNPSLVSPYKTPRLHPSMGGGGGGKRGGGDGRRNNFGGGGDNNGGASALLCQRLDSTASAAAASAANPRFSTSSIDELLFSTKSSRHPDGGKFAGRNLSGDSSSGHDSVSSSFTVRTHLSVDSGNEMMDSGSTSAAGTPPLPSPDSVFAEPPTWKVQLLAPPLPPPSSLRHRSSSLPKVDEAGGQKCAADVGSVSYAKLARYVPAEPKRKPADRDDDDYLKPIAVKGRTLPVTPLTGCLSPLSAANEAAPPPPKVPPRLKPAAAAYRDPAVSQSSPGLYQGPPSSEKASSVPSVGYSKVGMREVAIADKLGLVKQHPVPRATPQQQSASARTLHNPSVANLIYGILPPERPVVAPLILRAEVPAPRHRPPNKFAADFRPSDIASPPTVPTLPPKPTAVPTVTTPPVSGYVTLDSVYGKAARDSDKPRPETRDEVSSASALTDAASLLGDVAEKAAIADSCTPPPPSTSDRLIPGDREEDESPRDSPGPIHHHHHHHPAAMDYWKAAELGKDSFSAGEAQSLLSGEEEEEDENGDKKTLPANRRKHFAATGPKTKV